jgi:hypothetical protein
MCADADDLYIVFEGTAHPYTENVIKFHDQRKARIPKMEVVRKALSQARVESAA